VHFVETEELDWPCDEEWPTEVSKGKGLGRGSQTSDKSTDGLTLSR
jgi:hypothetical protein